MEAIELLTKDHDHVRELFRKFSGGGGLIGLVRRAAGSIPARERAAVLRDIIKELETHTRIEEQAFYPAVRGLEDAELDRMVTEALEEHGKVKEQLRRLRQEGVGDDQGESLVSQLEADVEHHASEEEAQMFPRLAQLMPQAQRAEIGRRLQSLKKGTSSGASKATPKRARSAASRTRAVGRKRKTVTKRASRKTSAGKVVKARARRKRTGGRRVQ